MTRIIILGSSGFLGTAIRQKFSKEKINAKFMIHNRKSKLKKNEFYGDILDKKTLLKNIKNDDLVINLVGQYDGNLDNFFDINLKGGFNLLEIARIKKNIKIIFASSINVYGESCKSPSKETDNPAPMTEYGIIKLQTESLYEKFSKFYGLDVTVLRFANIYGKNKKSGLMTNLLKSTPKKPIQLTHNGQQQRDFLFIDDAVAGIIKAIKKQPPKFQVFNISSNCKITPNQIIQLLKQFSKNKIYYKLTTNSYDEKCIWANNSKAKKILSFNPKTDVESGLNQI